MYLNVCYSRHCGSFAMYAHKILIIIMGSFLCFSIIYCPFLLSNWFTGTSILLKHDKKQFVLIPMIKTPDVATQNKMFCTYKKNLPTCRIDTSFFSWASCLLGNLSLSITLIATSLLVFLCLPAIKFKKMI